MAGRTRRFKPVGSAVWPLLGALVVVAGSVGAVPAVAQDLPFKRSIPGEGVGQCGGVEAAPIPDEESRSEASRLGSSASQALILGDRQRARDLLARATEINPASAELAYQYGRVLEELGAAQAAAAEYCRVLAVQDQGPEADDARARLDAFREALGVSIPDQARAAFRQGLNFTDAGRFEAAVTNFEAAVRGAPEWAEAYYNLGAARARTGRRAEAADAFERYLELEPDAPDAIVVSQQIGQLQVVPTPLPSPGAAFALGLIPGMGHFYSGRPLAGVTFLALAGGAAGAGLFVEDVEIVCITELDAEGQCPSGQVLSETSDRPLLTAGLGAAAAITLIGAIEAFVRARGVQNGDGQTELALDLGPMTIRPPSLGRVGRTVDVSLLRITFR